MKIGQLFNLADKNNDKQVSGKDLLDVLKDNKDTLKIGGKTYNLSDPDFLEIFKNLKMNVGANEDPATALESLNKAASIEDKLAVLKDIIINKKEWETMKEDVDEQMKKFLEDNKFKTETDAAKSTDAKIKDKYQDLALAREVASKMVAKFQEDKEAAEKAIKDKEAGYKADKSATEEKLAKAQSQTGSGKAAGAGNNTNKPSGAKGETGTGKAEGSEEVDHSYGATPGTGVFDATAMFKASALDNFKLEALDTINESQKKQKMMMLFFYFAQMAMSGDIGAMYQFMRFITYVISRDKAMQNVWMGTKLMQLQDVSREATQRLLNMDQKEGDLESQTKFAKAMQEIKSEEGMIATDQKLIAQMMEEFGQVTEALSTTTKGLLDMYGSTLRTLSKIA